MVASGDNKRGTDQKNRESSNYYYYYIQVLRPYASLWAYDRRASNETMYKMLIYIHKNVRKKHIEGSLDVYTPDIYLFVHALSRPWVSKPAGPLGTPPS